MQPAANAWLQEIYDYRHTLGPQHPDSVDSLLIISDEMRSQVVSRFGKQPRHRAVRNLARWLIDEGGHNMEYDVLANLTPLQAFEKRRGNCLSFTILLRVLAKELDINIEINEVDIPNTWSMDEQLGMVYYRHVNAMLNTVATRQIFDLAMERYYAGYPQKFISEEQALALLHNNRAMDLLGVNDPQQAIHNIKLAISLDRNNSDIWTNYGVLMKRGGQLDRAKFAFVRALELDKYSIPAASNLERFYREQGEFAKAKQLEKQAKRARLTNPYHHYQLALQDYKDERYQRARRATERAIGLHDMDPRFYELRSLIAQKQFRYSVALKSLKKAVRLASSDEQRGKYLSKAQLVSRRAIAEFEKRKKNNQRNGNIQRLREQTQNRHGSGF